MPNPKRSLVQFTTFALAALLGAGLVLAQGGPPAGKWEVTDAGKSWPHEVKYSGSPHDGKSAADLLRQIHDKAVAALPGATGPQKTELENVIEASLDCLALDGNFAVSNPPVPPVPAHHSTFTGSPAHTAAKAKVLNAYNAAFPPAGPPNWAVVGSELQHGH